MYLPDIIFIGLSGLFAFIAYTALKKRKKAEQEYRWVKNNLSNFLGMTDQLSQGVCILDREKRLIFINQTMQSLLLTQKETMSFSDVISSFPNPYTFSDTVDQVITLHRSFEEKEIKLGEKTVSLQLRPLKNEENQLTGVLLLLTDTTAEQAAIQMKEDFTKVISHELRSPLTTIRAASQFLRMQGATMDTNAKDKLLSMIDEQTEKLIYEAELILLAAQLEGSEFTVDLQLQELHTFLKNSLPQLLAQAEEKQIMVTTDVDSSLPQTFFDKKYLMQALAHIISNSIKFTSNGGKIHVSAIVDQDLIQITISDTGCGIPQQKQKTLFSRFSHISSPSENIGIGLGLYITKGIIEEHGGTISLESEEGVGTTVTLTLPLYIYQTSYSQTTQQPTSMLHN